MSEQAPIHLVCDEATKTLGDLGDDDLMLLAKSGRQDAFEKLLRRHEPLVFGIAARFLADRALGRDVMTVARDSTSRLAKNRGLARS